MHPRLLPLGTGSILLAGGRSASSYLLEVAGQRTLIDCGPGSLLRLREAGIDPMTIDHVVISHFHPDHHADLLGLLFLRANPQVESSKARLVIHAPTGLRRILSAWQSVYGKWIAHPDEDVQELEPGAHRVGALELEAFRAAHTMPAYSYRFDAPDGLSVAYSGDSDLCDELVEACRGVDFCWLECSFPDGDGVEGHLTPGRIREILERARPRAAGLTHFYPPMFELLQDEDAFVRSFAGLETRVQVLHDLRGVDLRGVREAQV